MCVDFQIKQRGCLLVFLIWQVLAAIDFREIVEQAFLLCAMGAVPLNAKIACVYCTLSSWTPLEPRRSSTSQSNLSIKLRASLGNWICTKTFMLVTMSYIHFNQTKVVSRQQKAEVS